MDLGNSLGISANRTDYCGRFNFFPKDITQNRGLDDAEDPKLCLDVLDAKYFVSGPS